MSQILLQINLFIVRMSAVSLSLCTKQEKKDKKSEVKKKTVKNHASSRSLATCDQGLSKLQTIVVVVKKVLNGFFDGCCPHNLA